MYPFYFIFDTQSTNGGYIMQMKGSGTMFSVLVADDEKGIRESIRDYLKAKGFFVETAVDGKDALNKFEENEFDLVILDIMMPVLNGFEVCKIIRKSSNLPILFLTAMSDEKDFLKGFEYGCDDYVVKPFPLSVLYQKANTLIKRCKGIDKENKITCCGITMDLNNKKVFANEKEIALSSKDFKILYYLIENKNIVLNRDLILTYAWGYDFDGDFRVVDTHIKRIRKALGDKSSCIKTIINTGYSFQEV